MYRIMLTLHSYGSHTTGRILFWAAKKENQKNSARFQLVAECCRTLQPILTIASLSQYCPYGEVVRTNNIPVQELPKCQGCNEPEPMPTIQTRQRCEPGWLRMPIGCTRNVILSVTKCSRRIFFALFSLQFPNCSRLTFWTAKK